MKKWKKLKLRKVVKFNKNKKKFKTYGLWKKFKLYNLIKINYNKLLFDYYLT